MASPVRLQLLMGPGVPLPAPAAVIEAVDSVKVESGSGETPSGFEIALKISNRSPLTTLFLLSGGVSIPFFRVVIAVTIGGTVEVLMDGVMTHHQFQSDGSPTSTLTIKGKDLTAAMDVIELTGLPYPAMPPAARVLLALAKYAAFGVVPLVIPSVLEDVPIPTDRIPRHQGTDYAYINQLAHEVGYVFYIDPGPTPGVSKAYWGPEIKVGAPQPALDLVTDGPHNNVSSLSFSFDKERKEMPVVYIQEPISKVPIPIPIPDITPLNPPLGVVPPLPPKLTFLSDTANLNPLAAAMRGLAYAGQHSDCVFGQGSLDVQRYGHVLRSRQLIGVRGAGLPFDGLHYVSSVTSSFKRGQFTQSFALARNALISTLPMVD
ncbi:MAG: hypothetical protein QOJ25_128 [Solirubrobacteraceae bacterium]|nr:hypothetical protein [Solirubrobacteraceae bacterium]